MSIYRVKKNSNYVVLNRTALNDERLSWKAKGIVAYMLSMPDDWKFYVKEIANHAKDGEDSLRSGIKELKECGYIKRYPIKDKKTKKIIEWETHVYESPFTEFPQQEKPDMEKPQVEKPDVENPTLLSTEELSIDSLSIDVTTTTTENPIKFYEQNLGMLSPIQMQELWDWVDDYNGQSEIVIEAMKVALDRNKKNMGFVKYLLKDWKDKGAKTLNDVIELQTEWASKGGSNNGKTRGSFKGTKPESRDYDDEIARRERDRPSWIKSI